MISDTLINKIGDKFIWYWTWVNGTTPNTSVSSVITIPTEFSISKQILVETGVGGTGIATALGVTTHNIGSLIPNQEINVVLELQYNGPIAAASQNYTFTANITGLDTNLTNNVETSTILFEPDTCGPIGSSNPTTTGGVFIDVSLNDVKCTQGAVSEWILDNTSIVNGTLVNWNSATGFGIFKYIDPSKNITFKTTMNCVLGASTISVGCSNLNTIYAQLENKNIFDHIPFKIKGSDLSLIDKAAIQLLYPTLTTTQIEDYCWDGIKNSNSVITGAHPLDCTVQQDTRTFVECSTINCAVSTSLPTDVTTAIAGYINYTPQEGDVVFIQHPDAQSVFKYNGTTWVRTSCGCVFKVSKDLGNLLKLGTDNAPLLETADISAISYTHPNHTGDVTSVGDGATVIVANAVTTSKIASNAVTTTKIATNAVTTAKIAPNAVTINELPAGGFPGSYIDGDTGVWTALPTSGGGGLTTVDTDASIDGTGLNADPLRLPTAPANSIKTNNTAAVAQPTDLSLPINTIVGRGPTGNISPITLGTGLAIVGSQLQYTETPNDNWGSQVVQHAPNGFTTGAGTAATAGAGVKLQNGVTTGDVITWNGTQWVSQAAPSQATLGYNETFAANLAVPATIQSFTGLTGDWYASANIGLIGTYTAVPATTGLVTVRIKKNATIIAQQYINVDLTNAGARISCSPNAMVGLIAADVLSIEIDTVNSFVFDAFSNFSIIEVTRGI